VSNFASGIKGRTHTEGIREQGAEKYLDPRGKK
jgi:hypothetical protein